MDTAQDHSVQYPPQHQAIIPAPHRDDLTVKSWADAGADGLHSAAARERRIFCNRTIDLGRLQAIGFDMDYTLAQYKPETFELLAYTQTVGKLTNDFGYPAELAGRQFDHQYMMRGLTIDKARGNVLKADRHKYVKIAFHGFRPLSKAERQATYSRGRARLALDGDDFTTIDTLFSLAEAYLFMQIVELKDSPRRNTVLDGKSYAEVYRDIRGAVDLCHRDGSLKAAVAASPATYIHPDPKLRSLLATFREAGLKVFLATNSLWDYTNVVMNYLLSGAEGAHKSLEWLDCFDAVMTGCRKPGFFTDSTSLLFAVDPETGLLSNTDNGAPILPIDAADRPSAMPAREHPASGHKVFQGGSVDDLHGVLGIVAASDVLYVGDHIYGDILRSKKSMGWRTMLIVPELEMELAHAPRCTAARQEVGRLRAQRDYLDIEIQRLRHSGGSAEEQGCLEQLRRERDGVSLRHKERLQAHHTFFHPVWGQMMKAGYQNSMYANLLERFACLYTSHVSNLSLYSPYMKFRAGVDVMAHEAEEYDGAWRAEAQDGSADGAAPRRRPCSAEDNRSTPA